MRKNKRVILGPSIGHWLSRRDMFSVCSPTLYVTFEDGTWVRFYTPVHDSHSGKMRDWIVPDDFVVRYKTARVLEARHRQYGTIRISLKTRSLTILDQTTDRNVTFTFTTEATVSGTSASDSAILPDSLADECNLTHSSRVNPMPFDDDVRTYVERKVLEKHFIAQSPMWESCCEKLWLDMELILSELLSGNNRRNGQDEVYPEDQRKKIWSAWWKIIDPAKEEIDEIYDSYRVPKNVLIQALTGRNRAKKKQQRKNKHS